MHTSDRFLRFAAECEVMAKFTRSPENRAIWNGMAKRWIRCAELVDLHEDVRRDARLAKRHSRATQSAAH
jgi:hypothetical protein